VPVALAAVLIAVARRRTLLPLAAGLISFIALLPLLGFVPFDFQAYSTVADHYVYLAMLGPALMLAWATARWRSGAVIGLASVMLVALAGVSFAQTWYWRDSHTLLNHALELNPRSYALYDNLAIDALNANDTDRAIELSHKAIDIRPHDAAAYLTIADAMRVRGNFAAAMEMYRKALECDPNYAPAVSNLAAILAQQGRLAEALPLVKRAIALDPESVDAQLNLGRMFVALEQFDNARRQFRTVLHLDPNNQPARELLADLDRVLGPSLTP
jgi:tetratricopeptide (TPR) repeat protein